MYSIFNKLNNSIINNSHFSKNEDFHIIFCSKFKNLLDDYISNYFTKYLFYFLFIAFWIFEIISFLNTGLSLLIGGFYNTQIALTDFSYFADLEIFSYFYSFFEFNVNFIKYLLHLLTGQSYFLIFLVFVFFLFSLLLLEFYTHLKQISILTLIYCYFFFLFLVFIMFKIELFNFEYASILMMFIPFLLSSTIVKKIELLDLYIVGLMVFLSLIHPFFIILFLFSSVYLFKDSILAVYKNEINTKIKLSEFNYLLIVLTVDIMLLVFAILVIGAVEGITPNAFLTLMFVFLSLVTSYTYSFFIKKK